MSKVSENRFVDEDSEQEIQSEKTKIRLNREEKEHLERLRQKIKDKNFKYLIDDILLFNDRPQYVILKDMYPNYK